MQSGVRLQGDEDQEETGVVWGAHESTPFHMSPQGQAWCCGEGPSAKVPSNLTESSRPFQNHLLPRSSHWD